MSREWKPGDVAIVTVNGEEMLAVRGRGVFESNWYSAGPVLGSRTNVPESMVSNRRPLVVIDPEDREQVERLTQAIFAALPGAEVPDVPSSRAPYWSEALPHAMQTALRSLIEPPKPEEPTGLGAVVEDDTGAYWTLYAPESGTWINYREGKRLWDGIDAVRVVHEGVTP